MEKELKAISRELSIMNMRLAKLIQMMTQTKKAVTSLKIDEPEPVVGFGASGDYKQSEK